MKTIDNLIETLSQEEKELHKELIEECKEREVIFNKLSQSIERDIKNICQLYTEMLKDIEYVYKISQDLDKICKGFNNDGAVLLSLIPDEKFFTA